MDSNFLIKCNKCGYKEMSTGLAADLSHLTEIKRCGKCGGPRLFKCPKCGDRAKMHRIKGNT